LAFRSLTDHPVRAAIEEPKKQARIDGRLPAAARRRQSHFAEPGQMFLAEKMGAAAEPGIQVEHPG